MIGPYNPNFALRLDELRAVWGSGRLPYDGPLEQRLTPEQRWVLSDSGADVERVLRDVAAGRPLGAPRDRMANAGHAIELWASWLGRRVTFVSDVDWAEGTHASAAPETLEFVVHRGVDLGVGTGRCPWPQVTLPEECPIVQLITIDELRHCLERLRALDPIVPPSLRRSYEGLTAAHEARVRDGLDLVSLDWM